MKLAFSTNAFTRVSLLEAFRIIREIGYDGVEIMADRPHLWPGDFSERDLVTVSETVRKLGLSLCNINGFMMKAINDIHHPSWIEPEEKDRTLRSAHTKACIRMARDLGVPSVSTEPGGPLGHVDRDLALEWFTLGMKDSASLAASMNVKLLIEPEPGLLFEDLAETVEFVRACEEEALGINFDLGHFFCIGRDPARLIREYPDYLSHVHIEDIGEDRVHRHLIPGQGAMDFSSIFQALHEVGYEGFITVELYPYEDRPADAAQSAFRYLEPYLRG